MELPQDFRTLLDEALAVSGRPEQAVARFEAAMAEESPACVRLNPWKRAHLPILDGAGRVPWSEEGWRLLSRPVYTLHPLFHAGAYYVQDASSMFVGAVLRRVLRQPDILRRAEARPLQVLDLCAAPGGKTTDAAASLRKAFGDAFRLLANEVNPRRASVLRDNVAVWGDPDVSVCSLPVSRLGALKDRFDIILVDAPCSGEGMFRKEPQALSQWSPALVAECAALQRKILDGIAPALAPGGYLIYSTCTFNTRENEGSVARLLERPDFRALDLRSWMAEEEAAAQAAGEQLLWSPVGTGADGVRLLPGLVRGEGQFCALLQRGADEESPECGRLPALPGEKDFPQPAADPDCPTGYRLDRSRWPNVPVDKQTALYFLHGDSLSLPDAPKGVLLLTYKDIPLGFVKNVGSRANNLHPKSRRIKMDVRL